MKIAVYTIAKNEEQFIQKWAESAKEADHLFILDTGSTDKTVEKATEAGIHVATAYINPWRFDDARNTALALLPDDIDICISLDMDEVLVPGWREELEKIAPTTTRPRYQYTWSWNGDKPGLQYGADKIHSRHGYRWKHPVHEILVADRIDEVQEWIGLEIHHHPDNTKSRGQYFPLLELAVKEDPFNDRNQYYLGREYFFNGMHDKALKMFKIHVSNIRSTWGPEKAASWRYMAKCDPENAEEYLKNAIKESPGRREPLVELGLHYYSKQMWKAAIGPLKKALEIKTKPLDYLCEEFAWEDLPYDILAVCFWNLGVYKEAYKYGKMAVNISPSNERLVNNLVLYSQSLDK